MRDVLDVAQRSNAFLRDLVLGSLEGEERRKGWRRMRPHADDTDVGTVHAMMDQCPMPEEFNERVSIDLGEGQIEQAVLADIIPLEAARARVVDGAVSVEFAFCDSYPVHLVPGTPNVDAAVTRVRTLPSDPRRELWMAMCLEMLYSFLGDDALAVDFTVEWVSDTYEELQLLELTLPES